MVATKAALSIRLDALADADSKSAEGAPTIGLESRAKLESRLRGLEHRSGISGLRGARTNDSSYKQQPFELNNGGKTYNTAADAPMADVSATEPKELSKEEKKALKKKRKHEEEGEEDNEGGESSEKKLSKEERKAIKKAKKEAEASTTINFGMSSLEIVAELADRKKKLTDFLSQLSSQKHHRKLTRKRRRTRSDQLMTPSTSPWLPRTATQRRTEKQRRRARRRERLRARFYRSFEIESLAL